MDNGFAARYAYTFKGVYLPLLMRSNAKVVLIWYAHYFKNSKIPF